jgi:hypothetical protein
MKYMLWIVWMMATVLGAAGGDALEDSLGKLSEKYESGGRGPATVSTGEGDPGGVSYGTYQLASKIGRADEFVREFYPKEFEGLQGGTPEFTSRWKQLAEEHPEQLRDNEHRYIRRTHYDPQVAKIEKALGLKISERSAALRDVLWSTSVHHGPNTDVVLMAAKDLETRFPNAAGIFTDRQWIEAIYRERGRMDDQGKLIRFRGVSERWIPALRKRFQQECQDALAMLDGKQ